VTSRTRGSREGNLPALSAPQPRPALLLPQPLLCRLRIRGSKTTAIFPGLQQTGASVVVVSGANRAPELPEVPTTSEAGFRDADYTFWIGLFAPSRTPRAIINKLHDETLKALETASVREKLAAVSVSPMRMTSEQFDARIKEEIASNAVLAKAAGIQPE
jgi:tripartite-type tricarboxylate transporter receptor subunit TctC